VPAGAGARKQDNEDNWIKPCVFALSGRIEADSGDNLAEAAQTCPAAGKEEGGGERGRGRGVRRPAGPSLERPTQHPSTPPSPDAVGLSLGRLGEIISIIRRCPPKYCETAGVYPIILIILLRGPGPGRHGGPAPHPIYPPPRPAMASSAYLFETLENLFKKDKEIWRLLGSGAGRCERG